MIDTEHPITPKTPTGPLEVVILGRLSKAKPDAEDTEKTIASSLEVAKEYISRVYEGEINSHALGEQISGMVADRGTILDTYNLVESGKVDLVLCEEIRCVYRNPRLQYAFVQDMFDMQTRFISIVDNIDTATDHWETNLCIATVRHGLAVPDASRRVRRAAKYSFGGSGMVTKVKFGYRKLTKEEAQSGAHGPKGLREAKIAELTPIWHEIRARLMNTQSPVAVVGWLNEQGISPGPYVKRKTFTVQHLKSAASDPKMHGTRMFLRMKHIRIFGTGNFRRERNKNPERHFVPELAHMTLEEQQSMLAAVGWEIEWTLESKKRKSPRRGISRYKTVWPSNSATCHACKGKMVIAGDHLRCPRCKKLNGRTCWNRVELRLDEVRSQTLSWMLEQFRMYPAARIAFVESAWKKIQERRSTHVIKAEQRKKDIAQLEKQLAKYVEGIDLGGKLQTLVAAIQSTEKKLEKLRAEEIAPPDDNDPVSACITKEDVERRMRDVIGQLMSTSFEFNEVMRQFFPVFVIQPVQALDSGQVHPRGKLRFQIEPPSAETPEGRSVEVVMDFFEPPVHIRLLPKILEERGKVNKVTGRVPSYVKIANKIGTSYMTVKRALGYARLMEKEGLTEPFRELSEAPVKASRWKNRDAKNDKAA